MRQIVLDTETTGLEVSQDHRIIEIGCVELVERKLTGNHYHQYINPNRDIDEGAFNVHGISNEFLDDKPSFDKIVDEFLSFVDGAELIIHNASFDIGFLNHELKKLGKKYQLMEQHCTVVDSLAMARKRHPGQKNNLDALCKRYGVDNSQRDLHGALLDAEILADVYLTMSGGQVSLLLGGETEKESAQSTSIARLPETRAALKIIHANSEELLAHQDLLQSIAKSNGGQCLWGQTSIEQE